MDYDEIINALEELDGYDKEKDHIKADELLIECALNTDMTKPQREHVVKLYNSIFKWYS